MEIYSDRKYWISDVYESIEYFEEPKPIILTVDDRDIEIMRGTDAIHFTFGTVQASLSTKDMR